MADKDKNKNSPSFLDRMKRVSGYDGLKTVAGAIPPISFAANTIDEASDGFEPGWFRRAALNTVDDVGGNLNKIGNDVAETGNRFVGGWKEAGDIVKGGLGVFDDNVVKPVMAESLALQSDYDKRKSTPFNIQQEFPEITNEYGGAAVQAALADNMIVASKEAVGKAAGVVDSLVTRGVSKDQTLRMARKESNNNPDVVAAVGSEYDAASKTSPPTGPVNDSGVNNITSKVQANVNGNDPTDNSISDEDLAAANADESVIYASAIDKTANKLHSQHITPKNWYESNSFNMSLIRFGLGLMSGEDYATAFSYAAQDYTKLSGREKREAYRDELLADGYREADIMSWIEDGNSNILKKPEAKDTFEQFTEKDGSVWQRNLNTKAVTKLQDAKTPKDMRGIIVQEGDRQILVNPYTGDIIKDYAPKPRGSGSGSGSGSGVGGSGLESPFTGNVVRQAGSTDTTKRAVSQAQLAMQGSANMNDAYYAASEEQKSSWLPKTVWNTLFRKSIGGAEGDFNTFVDESFRASNPAAASYVDMIGRALQPLLRYKSGATLKDSEIVREALTSSAKPGMDSAEKSRADTYLATQILSVLSTGDDHGGYMSKDILNKLSSGNITDVKLDNGGIVIQIPNSQTGEPEWHVAEQFYSKTRGWEF